MSNKQSGLEVNNNRIPNQGTEVQTNQTRQQEQESEKIVVGGEGSSPNLPQQSPPLNGVYGRPGGHSSQQLPPYSNGNPQQYPHSPRSTRLQRILSGLGPICGMRRKVFWIVLAIGIVILIAISVGAGVGISMSKKGSDRYVPYALETGVWDINNARSSSYSGICVDDLDMRAVSSCGSLNLSFRISKVGDGYKVSNSPYTTLNGLLNPPLSQKEMYWRSSESVDQAFDVEAFCMLRTNLTIRLGRGKHYEITNEHYTKDVCELDNGQTSTPDQKCDCDWLGVAPESKMRL